MATKQAASVDTPPVHEKHLLPPRAEQSVTDTQQMTYARFKQLPLFDKQWVLAQGLATFSSALVAVTSALVWFLTPRHRNCDDYSPLSRAWLSALNAFAICLFAWQFAYELRLMGKKLDGPNSWTLEERRARRGRSSFCLILIAAGQILAAIMHFLSAFRTSREAVGFGIVPIVAAVATVSCAAAGANNIWLAGSFGRSRWRDMYNTKTEPPKDEQESPRNANEVSSLYDISLSRMTAFNKGWLITHAVAFGAIVCVTLISSSLLWSMPCNTTERKSLYKFSENNASNTASLVAVVPMTLTVWLLQAGYRRRTSYADLKIFAPLAPIMFFMAGASLCFSAYDLFGGSDGFVVIKIQSSLAGIASLLAGGYDAVLMLKPRLRTTPSGIDTLEAEAGKSTTSVPNES